MDWDKLRIFHAAATAGSFTHAGDALGMSQSAVSRQVSSLEQDLGVTLFYRGARGLVLTEQGDLLHRTTRDVLTQLETVKTRLTDSRERPSGLLRVTTTVGIGSTWLTRRIHEFFDLYPEVSLELILDDQELDLGTRQADVAIRLRQPSQSDLIQRKLFTVHFHLYATPAYTARFGNLETIEDLDSHRIIVFGEHAPGFLREMNWLMTAGRPGGDPRTPILKVNNLVAMKSAVERGIGIALLPDYLIEPDTGLQRLIPEVDLPSFDTFFVYPTELRNTARINAFRDFLVAKAQRWSY